MKVVIAAAGTGGHINPGIAIANKIKSEQPDSEIIFIGTDRGLENDLVPKAGYGIKHIGAYGVYRKPTIENLKRLIKTIHSISEAKTILKNRSKNDENKCFFSLYKNGTTQIDLTKIKTGKIGVLSLGKLDIYQNKDRDKDKDKDTENIISFLNSTTGSKYKASTDKTRRLIAARIAEGFTVDDFKTVISKKAKEWQGTDMAQYLRPETLFGTKFEGYLNQPERNNRRSPLSRAERERQEGIDAVNRLIAEYEEEERQNEQVGHNESHSTFATGI